MVRGSIGLLVGVVLVLVGSLGGCASPPAADRVVGAPASMGWLVGDWRSERADGEVAQERWSAPLGDGTLLGVFRSVEGGAVSFIELMTITTDADGQVRLRLKHFGPDLRGWEPAGAAGAWTLERAAGRTAVFRREIEGGWEELTYGSPDPRTLRVMLRVEKNGRVRELGYSFAR